MKRPFGTYCSKEQCRRFVRADVAGGPNKSVAQINKLAVRSEICNPRQSYANILLACSSVAKHALGSLFRTSPDRIFAAIDSMARLITCLENNEPSSGNLARNLPVSSNGIPFLSASILFMYAQIIDAAVSCAASHIAHSFQPSFVVSQVALKERRTEPALVSPTTIGYRLKSRNSVPQPVVIVGPGQTPPKPAPHLSPPRRRTSEPVASFCLRGIQIGIHPAPRVPTRIAFCGHRRSGLRRIFQPR